MFGKPGAVLLEDTRYCVLKPYRRAEIKALEEENVCLCSKMEDMKRNVAEEISEEFSINYVMLKRFKERNERILKCYLFHRLKFIHDGYFTGGNIYCFLSSEEEKYAEKYHEALEEYLNPFKMMNFSSSEPPIQFFVQIITLEDCGVVMDGEDFVELKKDRVYFIKKSAVVHLIDSGLARVS